jgi:hypothetical protein
MTLMQVVQILSITTSSIAIIVSLYGFARFVRRWWLRSYRNSYDKLAANYLLAAN